MELCSSPHRSLVRTSAEPETVASSTGEHAEQNVRYTMNGSQRRVTELLSVPPFEHAYGRTVFGAVCPLACLLEIRPTIQPETGNFGTKGIANDALDRCPLEHRAIVGYPL